MQMQTMKTVINEQELKKETDCYFLSVCSSVCLCVRMYADSCANDLMCA